LSRSLYTGAVPLKLTLPTDLAERLSSLGDVLATASSDIVFAYLFGSASTGQLTGQSDVDVAIYCAPGSDCHAARLAATRAASKHLGTDALDVVVLNTAPISLAGRWRQAERRSASMR